MSGGSPTEIKTFWEGLDNAKMSEGVRLSLKFMLVTSQRRGEVTSAPWAEFDLENEVWKIPGMRTKNGHKHRVPLSRFASNLLADIRRQSDDPKWLFPSLHDIWQAGTKADAEKAFDLFIKMYEPKYPKAAICLQKDRAEMLAFYDFPAQHWQSIRTSNPIESTFGTIRHRTRRSKGCLSRDGMLHMIFKLGQCAEKKWRRLRGFDYLTKVITGVKFKDGVEVTDVNLVAA